MSEKIPKAEDLIRGLGQFNEGQITVLSTLIIEHTKDHVKAALQSASKKVTCDVFYEEWTGEENNEKLVLDKERNLEASYVFPYLRNGMVVDVNKESILNSYNSENIK